MADGIKALTDTLVARLAREHACRLIYEMPDDALVAWYRRAFGDDGPGCPAPPPFVDCLLKLHPAVGAAG